jgi:hypothetical protein
MLDVEGDKTVDTFAVMTIYFAIGNNFVLFFRREENGDGRIQTKEYRD